MIHYPKGQGSLQAARSKASPNPNYGSRGMDLEDLLNQTNEYYRLTKRAVIHKKPTPIQVVSVDYPSRSQARITQAYYRQASTTDYNGIYRGYYIDFEAKQVQNKTSFPLKNLHQHQLDHMMACHDQGGIVFLILSFTALREYFLLEATYIHDFIIQNGDDKKSIPLSLIRQFGYQIPLDLSMRLDYLPILDHIIKSKYQGGLHDK